MGLRWKIATATDSDQKTFLQGSLDHGIWARQTALSMYREAQESKISAINPKEETDTLVVPSSDNEPAREATVNSDIPNLDPQPSSEQIAASIQEWEAFSDDDLKNIYSGGDCYKLALAMHDVDPQRFELWAATSQVSESGHHLDEAYSAHWFVKDKANNNFIDIYDEYESADKVLEEWPDFMGDETVQYKQMPSREEAVQIMHKDFGAIVSAFNPTWKEETAYTIQRMGLIKSLNSE